MNQNFQGFAFAKCQQVPWVVTLCWALSRASLESNNGPVKPSLSCATVINMTTKKDTLTIRIVSKYCLELGHHLPCAIFTWWWNALVLLTGCVRVFQQIFVNDRVISFVLPYLSLTGNITIGDLIGLL